MANGGNIRYSVNFDVNKTGLNEIKASLQEIQRLTAQDLMKINNTSLSVAQQDLEKLKVSVKQLDGALDKAFNSDLGTLNVSKFNQELKKLNLNQIYKDFSNAGAAGQAAFRNTTTQILTTNMQLKQTHNLLDNMATTMANTIKWGVASSVMDSFTGSVQQAYGYVKSLDSSLNDIRIVTGYSADAMDKFAEKANRAAKALGQSTTDYTEASLIYYQQGLSDKEVEARAETTLKAANVTGQSGQEVSEQLTAVWNGYKVSAEEAEVYVDKLAAVAASTASDLEELSTGMSKVASAANAMGVDVDQLNAQLATIVSVTRQAPESVGTALKTIYARMSDLKMGETDEDGLGLGDVSGTMEQMGIKILDETGNLRDMGKVVEDVAAKWDTWTKAQQTAMAQVMAGKRQYNNLVALFENWDMYEEALNTSENSMGTLQKQQDIYMESTAAHLQQLKTASEDLYDSLLDPDGINPVIDGLTLVTDLMSNFVDSIGGGGGVLLGLGSIATKVFSQQIANGIATFVTNMQSAKENANQLRAELEVLSQYETANLGDAQIEKLVSMKRQVLDLDKSITNEERNIANEYINQQNELYKQQEALEIRKKAAEETYKRATGDSISLQGAYNTDAIQAELLSSADEMERRPKNDAAVQQHKEAKLAYEELTNAANQYINVANLEESSSSEVASATENLTKTVEKYNQVVMEQLNAAEVMVKSDDYDISNKKELIAELEKLNKLRSQDGTLNLKNKNVVEQLNKVEEARINVYKKEAQTMRQTAQEIKNFANETQNGANKADQLTNSWNNFIKQIDLRAKIQQSVQLVSSFGQLASAFNTIRQIGSIWSNEDLSTGEKLLQTVTNLGFAIPMLANSIGQVNKVLGIGASITGASTTAQTAYTAVIAKRVGQEKLLNVATQQGISLETASQLAAARNQMTEQQRIQTRRILIALKKKEMTAEQADIALKEIMSGVNIQLGFSFKAAALAAKEFLLALGPIGWAFMAVGAISGAIALIDKFTVSAEEAGEALTESIEKYKEFENELQSVEGELQTTKDRLTELLKIAEERKLSITEEQELIRLEAQNIALENQIELIKQKQALESKKVARNAETAHEKGTYNDTFGKTVFQDYSYYSHKDDTGELKPEDAVTTYWDKGVSRKSLSTEGFEVQSGEIKLDDTSTFESWKKSMEDLQQQALDNANKAEDGSKDELEWQEVAEAIASEIEEKEDIYEDKRQNYLTHLEEGYEAAIEALPSLREQNTDGRYDDTIKYYEDIVYDYQKQLGTLDATVEGAFENLLSLSENQKLNLQTSENVLDHENEKVNEDVLEDIIGAENVEKLKIYSEELNLSMYDVVNRYQEMGELVGLSNEEIKQKLAEIRQEKINDIVEQTNNKYKDSDIEPMTSKDIEDSGLTAEQLANWEQISEYIDKSIASTNGWTEAIKEAVNEYQKISEIEKSNQFLEQSAEKYDLNIDELKNYAEHLQETAKISEDIDDKLESNIEATREIAVANARLNKGLDTLVDNWEDWEKALKSGEEGSFEYAKAIEEIGKTLEDILDIDDFGVLSDSFIADNLDDIKAAAEGSLDAVQRLMEAAAQDIVMSLDLPQEELMTLSSELSDFIATTDFDDLEVGATLDDSAFIDTLNNMIKASELTIADAENILESLRFNPEITYKEVPVESVQFSHQNATAEIINPLTGEVEVVTAENIHDFAENGRVRIPTINGSATTYKGSPRKAASSPKRSSGGGKKKGGGGGGSKTSEPKKENPLKEEIDRYHDVNIKLKQVEEELNDLDKVQDKLFGADLIKNLNKQLDILEKQRDVYKEKLQIAKAEQKELQNTLKKEGVTFNNDGTIKNYMQILQAKQNEINRLITQYNGMSAEAQEKFKEETLDPAKESYDEFKEKLENYDDLILDTIPEIENALDDIIDREVEINIQKLNMEVELRLDLTEAQKDWNEFKRKIIDGIKDDDIFGNAMSNTELFKKVLENGTIEAGTKNLNTTMAEIAKINAGGVSDIFGKDKAAAMENLEEQMSNLMGHLEDLADIEEEISEAYLDMIDEVGEAFDEQIESYEYVGDLINHNMNMIKLVNGEDAYTEMAQVYKEQKENNLSIMKSQKAAVDYYRQMMETETDPEAVEKWTELWKGAVEDLNSTVEDSVEWIIEEYGNAVNEIFDRLDDKMTNGKGLDYLTQEWELKNENADQYLDTINSTYEIQKLERKIQDSINNTDSLSAQKKLNDFMDEELEMLREKEKLTQYDVDRANALYEVKLKEIALEEAQQNKSQMRLRRDASGNYSYRFVADQDSISKAQQELDDARNSLYNMDKDEYRENQQEILDVYTEFQEKMREAANLSAEEKELIEQQYNERINALLEENGYIRTNLMESAFADLAALYGSDIANFQQMSMEEQDILMGQIVPNWDSGIQDMIDTMTNPETGFGPMCKLAMEELDLATQEYNESLAMIKQTSEDSFGAAQEGYTTNIELARELAEAQQTNIDRTKEEKDAIGELKLEVDNLVQSYKDAYTAAKDALTAAQKLREYEAEQAAKEAAKNNPGGSGGSGDGDKGSKGDTGGKDGGNGGGKTRLTSEIIDGVAGAIWYWSPSAWGTGNERKQKMESKFGAGAYNTIQSYINDHVTVGGKMKKSFNYGWGERNKYKNYYYSKFDTGGYTGDWPGSDGRMAMLHKKELVLNADDTKNFLSAINLVRDMESMLAAMNDSMLSRTSGMTASLAPSLGFDDAASNTVNQNVSIQASFPGVSSRAEIEEAFQNLVNIASQHAFNTQR